MTVVAITPIQHGAEDGTITLFKVGDELSEGTFSEDQLREFIANQSAVELGTDRKYTEAPSAASDPGAADSETRLRDRLIQQSKEGGDYVPAATAPGVDLSDAAPEGAEGTTAGDQPA